MRALFLPKFLIPVHSVESAAAAADQRRPCKHLGQQVRIEDFNAHEFPSLEGAEKFSRVSGRALPLTNTFTRILYIYRVLFSARVLVIEEKRTPNLIVRLYQRWPPKTETFKKKLFFFFLNYMDT